MSTQARATVMTDASATAVPALQRACVCGEAAGGTGKCTSCAEKEHLGVQPKLRINPPGDRWEQEADRIADQVVADRPAALTGPLPVTPLVQRQPIEEEEELLQASGCGAYHPPAAPGPAFAGRVFAETGGGRPLDNAVSTYLEPRLGRSVSAIRVHDGPRAADLNRRINARAFTLGNHIFFGSGGLDPATTRGRRLLAHEIVHTFQQGAHRGVQRTPDDDPEFETADAPAPGTADTPESQNEEPEVYGPERIDVLAAISIRNAVSPKLDAIETSVGPVYPGDTIFMDVRVHAREVQGDSFYIRTIKAPVDVGLPAGDLELAEQLSKGRFRIRVISDPAALAEPKTVEMTINSEAFTEPVTVQFAIEVAPEVPSVVDPEGAILEESLGLAEGDVARREAFVARIRREGGTEDDLDKARANLTDSRSQVRSLSRDLRQHNRQSPCTVSEQRLIEPSLKLGAEHVARAISVISPGAVLDQRTRSGLRRFFKLDAQSADPAEIAALLQRNADVLNLARTSMLVARPDQFVCSPDACKGKDRTGAFVTRSRRGAEVNLCRRWLDGKVPFEVPDGVDEERAYALLHEFIHLSGITALLVAADEAYFGSNDQKWRDLDHGQTLLMADAYASFGWFMGKGGA